MLGGGSVYIEAQVVLFSYFFCSAAHKIRWSYAHRPRLCNRHSFRRRRGSGVGPAGFGHPLSAWWVLVLTRVKSPKVQVFSGELTV